MKNAIFTCLVLAAVSSLCPAADEVSISHDVLAAEESALRDYPALRASCNLGSADITEMVLYNGEYEIGDVVALYLDPGICGELPIYPFEITAFSFRLGQIIPTPLWPVTFDIIIYDMATPGDMNDGPGVEICRQSVVCQEQEFLHQVGTVYLDPPCMVTGPFFAGLEFTYQGPGGMPIIVYDDSYLYPALAWFYSDGQWRNWDEAWPPPNPGFPHLWVHGHTPLSECYADADVNNDGIVLSVADVVYLDRYLWGQLAVLPVPYKADINGDSAIDQLDAELYWDYFNYGGWLWPGYPRQTSCEPKIEFGGCCIDRAECKILHPLNCQAAGGEYWGSGTKCDVNPGDANGDETVNVGDAVYLVDYLAKGGPAPNPYLGNGDPDGDCCIGWNDVAYVLCIFASGGALDPVVCTCPDAPLCDEGNCTPGDANYDSTVNVADAVFLINFVFNAGPDPEPYAILSGDANNDANVDVGDAVYIINYVFKGGEAPVECGEWMISHPCLHPDGHLLYP